MITAPIKTNFLYRFETGTGRAYFFTNIAENQIYNGEEYVYAEIEHDAPTFSGEPQDGEIDVTVKDTSSVADLFVLSSPPYAVTVKIFDYDRFTGIATPYYKGWIVRQSFTLDRSTVDFHCKTLWHFFERESFSDSLSALSRYSVFDPRSGVDVEQYRVGITVTALNDERDVLTVTGITEIDGWFKGGLIIAPDRDMRTVLEHTGGSLSLNGAFPSFTLDVGFTADIYPGDDLTYDTWANKFGDQTNNGEAFGGWQYMPTVDPAVRGVS